MTGQRKTGSGKWYDIGPLFIRSGFCQSSARSSEIAARVPVCTSADVIFQRLTVGHRGRSEIDKGRRMGKPRSDGWRECKLPERLRTSGVNKILLSVEIRARRNIGKSGKLWVFTNIFSVTGKRGLLGFIYRSG